MYVKDVDKKKMRCVVCKEINFFDNVDLSPSVAKELKDTRKG